MSKQSILFLTFSVVFLLAIKILVFPLSIEEAPISIEKEGKGEINCFVYHRFGEENYPSTNISLETFERQLQWLQENHFTVLTLGEALKLIDADNLPQKSVVLTVDDGYRSFILRAFPLLQKYNYKATVFVNTATVGGGSYMNWKELKQLVDAGIEIGNHSHSHAYFLNYSKEEKLKIFKEDVAKAQKTIRENLGISPELFAYPYGEYSLDLKKAVQELGFKAAAAQNSGVISSYSDRFALPRFPMGSSFASLEGFRSKAKMKALEVKNVVPESSVLSSDNPPILKLEINDSQINLNQIQCFVQGSKNCRLIADSRNPNQFTMKAEAPLNNRRTLYTITAPSLDGRKWFWYSHLWINPQVSE
ncbi:polysaccharide deacetylase family protein [Xanthovirga aplysinae]|uniref:polysaccharide deacetylase family protein n=1 Tax=Xanthovirga aplysinae TaxID=2529853 RepID=UPI0016571817|nr:polysaccharide deacetylase family protein [Xanthovirga aplysinae]